MSALEELNQKIAVAEARLWPMVRDAGYGPEAEALAARISDMRAERRAILAGGETNIPEADDYPADAGITN